MKKIKYILIILCSVILLSIIIFFSLNQKGNLSISELHNKGSYDLIIENYKNGKYIEITDYKENQLIADAFYQKEEYESSQQIYSNILKDKTINDLERADLLYSYAMVLVKLKNIDEAFAALQEGVIESESDLTTSRKLKRSYGLLAKSFPREYNVENALIYLKDVIDLDITGDDYESNYAYALLLYYAEEYEGSLLYAQNTLKIKFDYYPAEVLIPKIYFESGNTEEAITKLHSLILKYPTDSFFNMYLAQIYEMTEDSSSAIKHYKKALEYDKENMEIHMGLIRCYITENKINALLDEIIVFRNTFPNENKYSKIIDKLEDKYFPKLLTEEELIEEKEQE